MKPVCLNHLHRQPRNTDIEDRHRRGVDDPQTYSFARVKHAIPVIRSRMAVNEEVIGRAGHICDVARAHSHMSPHRAVGQRLRQAVFVGIFKEVRNGAFLEVVCVADCLQLFIDALRAFKAPVGEHHHILTVIFDRISACGIDNDRTIMANLLLQTGV